MLMARESKSRDVKGFLQTAFSRVSAQAASEILSKVAWAKKPMRPRQLDVVLASRPDLEADLCRALEVAAGVEDPIVWLGTLATEDAPAHDALVLAVCAGYYLHPEVQRRLGYPGQVAQEVSVAGLPDYVHEGLLERVYERGPIYRPTPDG